MNRKTLFGRIFPIMLAIIAVSLLALAWYASHAYRSFYLEQTQRQLEGRARLAAELFRDDFSEERAEEVDALCKRLGAPDPVRITVILPSGEVIGDSEENYRMMDNHGDRPEIREALADGVGSSVRFSDTLRRDMMYVAAAVRKDGRGLGVVRTSVSLAFVDRALSELYRRVFLVGLAAAFLAGTVSLVVSRRIGAPLEELRRGAARFARGDLERKLPGSGFQEIDDLAGTLNEMAEQLSDRIRTETEQRNQLEAVLSSMAEGVLSVDSEERILSLNEAAARLLSVDRSEALGRPLREVARNSDLRRLISEILAGKEPEEEEIELQPGQRILVHARKTALRDKDGENAGALVVLHDLTRLRRLENVRSDFVANVSHELKTPITSIKGFTETLLSGAAEDREERERFLKIIASQAERLHAIVEDLLSLSNLEEEAAKGEVPLEKQRLADVLEAAVNSYRDFAEIKKVAIHLTCPDNLEARVNPSLLEQAIVNLLDNAVKYSEAGKTVRLEAHEENGEIAIRVRDEGRGIESQHLPRLFERFYRADKARSRELGGTGLGLSIVKHVALAHGGRASVESRVGQGSVFSIHIPLSVELTQILFVPNILLTLLL